MGGDALLYGGGAHGQGGGVLVWYVSEIASCPVVEGRAHGKTNLFIQCFSVGPIHQVEVTHFVLVSGTETLGEGILEVF